MRGYNITSLALAIVLATILAAAHVGAQASARPPEPGSTPSTHTPQIDDGAPARAPGAHCAALRSTLDDRIARAAVGDPRHHRRPGAPWLRTDRFLHRALRRAIRGEDPTAVQVILARMSALDAAALARERGRLTPVPASGGSASASSPGALASCRQEALQALQAQAPETLLETAAAPVPDQYSALKRLLGGYVFAQPFLRVGARDWQQTERAAIAAQAPLDAGPRLVFAPPGTRTSMSAVDRAHLLRDMRGRHALGWPQPSPLELQRLTRAFAPELVVGSRAQADRIGRLVGQDGRPRVLTDHPVAYTDAHLVHWGEHVLLQLSYTFWFPERPRTGPLDPYGGPVDGIVWRVTLGDDGEPLLWDSIHPCGCYHTLFLPADRALRLGSVDTTHEERPLVLPGPDATAAVRLRYSPGTHHVRELAPARARARAQEGSQSEQGAAERLPYRLEPYSALLEAGPARPPFSADGLLAGTERLERWFLWPSGIASPGAMRSSGRHAIAFLGRRHFETAELVDGLIRPVPAAQR